MTRTVMIDALGIDQVGGVRTGIHNLLGAVFRLERELRFTVLLSKREPLWDEYRNVRQMIVRARHRFFLRILLQCQLPIWARRQRAGLVHFTKNLGVFGLSCPYIVTVHDLTTLRLSGHHTHADVVYWRWIEPRTVRGAARVVTVSHDTARDVERFYGISTRQIEVIYWAPHERFAPIRDAPRLENMRRRYHLPERYILFVGILAKKKNLPTLLRALAQLRARMPGAPDLVVAGREYPQSADIVSTALARELGLVENVHFAGAVPDEDLPLFYSGSELYILPSLHEGFGIPCLEAMACGVPVIVTRAGALPEIVGDAALVVDSPLDAAGLSMAMERLLRDGALREEMIGRGYRRAGSFSWERSAQRMLDVYYSVLDGGSSRCEDGQA
jgi:glycosyltransferase involved in cell wall biosynthesis